MIYTRFGSRCKIVDGLAAGRREPARIVIEDLDGNNRRTVYPLDLRADGGAVELEAAFVAATGFDFAGCKGANQAALRD